MLSASEMPESVFVDTGYILALVNGNDQHHAEELLLSERYDGQPVVVTDAVLLESGNALSRMDRNAAVQSSMNSASLGNRRWCP